MYHDGFQTWLEVSTVFQKFSVNLKTVLLNSPISFTLKYFLFSLSSNIKCMFSEYKNKFYFKIWCLPNKSTREVKS